MDKKTVLLAVIFIVLALAWPSILQMIHPPPPRSAAPPVTTNQVAHATNGAQPAIEAAAPTAEQPAETPKVKKPEGPKPPERTVRLENELVRLEFTSYGGGIKHAELKRYNTQHGKDDTVDLNHMGKIPIGLVSGIDGFDTNTVFEIRQNGANGVTLEAVNDDGVKITKEFRLGSDYMIDGSFAVANAGSATLKQTRLEIVMGTAAAVAPRDAFEIPYVSWGNQSTTEFIDPSAFDSSFFGRKARAVVSHENVPLTWTGVDNRFFCALWMPKISNATVSATREIYGEPTMTLPFFWTKSLHPYDYGLIGQLSPPAFNLAPNQNYRYEFQLFAGPKEYHRLHALGHRQIAVMHWWSWIEWMSELLLKSMNGLYHLIPNYFWVIIIITIVIKLLFWPLTAMSNRSMKGMQALGPKITALREKFKEDPQKMNAEMMRLYREHKVNPMAGCLPTIVQIPVFIGLYNMLRTSIELRGHGFLWIKDLAQPDSILQLGGFALNPLPLAMVSTTIWQMRITPTSGDPMQQKMMMLMPIMFLFFFYGMPSGLVLYWTVQNIFSIIQMKMTKHAAASAGGTASTAPSPATIPPNKPKPKTKVKTK